MFLKSLTGLAMAAVVAAVGLLALTGLDTTGFVPTTASATGNTQISGVGTWDAADDCNGSPDAGLFNMTMTGDLVGCWYTTLIEFSQETPSGVYRERGTETFVGCLAGGTTCGSFSTTYNFTAKYAVDCAGEIDFTIEIHGRCQHPIVSGSGTGGFAGITGRVDFKDDVENGVAIYRGHIDLP
jgi:hypothetical protein